MPVAERQRPGVASDDDPLCDATLATQRKLGMGVRQALFPVPALGATMGCRLPDAILHGQRSSFGLVAGPSNGSRSLDFE